MAAGYLGMCGLSDDSAHSSNPSLPKTKVKDIITDRLWHRRFHTVRKYGLRGDNRLHYGHIPFVHKYDRAPFLGLLIDEYNLRVNMQEQERIQRRIISLRPAMEYDDLDNSEWPVLSDEDQGDYSDLIPLIQDSSHSIYDLERQTAQIAICRKAIRPHVTKSREKGILILQRKLEDVKSQHMELSRRLYEVEVILPEFVRQNYDWIRQDPKWYMRRELVKDCVDRGGCCGRDCGCCALRARRYYEKGVGHCTIECLCCVGCRGFRPSVGEKSDTLKGMTMILKCDLPTHFVRMVNGFFSKA